MKYTLSKTEKMHVCRKVLWLLASTVNEIRAEHPGIKDEELVRLTEAVITEARRYCDGILAQSRKKQNEQMV